VRDEQWNVGEIHWTTINHQHSPSMIHKLLRLFQAATVFTVVAMTSLCLQAQPVAPGDLLRQAYATLSVANHDYKGHRVLAMKQIEAAARLLSTDIRGDGKGHITQGLSDEQLRTARGMLEQARAGLAGKPLRHVNRAINQINIALRIR
jgi:hypothetical protein